MMQDLEEDVVTAAWGAGAQWDGWEAESEGSGGEGFASEMELGIASLKLPILIKRIPEDEKKQEVLSSRDQFQNEVLAYSRLLPALGASDMVPRMYYGRSGDDPIVVLQLLQDYKAPTERAFMRENQLRIAVKAMGRFHALSYQVPPEVLPGKDQLRPVGFTGKPDHVFEFLQNSMMRGIRPLMNEYSEVQELGSLLESDTRSVVELLESNQAETEVLIHGDFNRNNLLFKGDSVKMIDFQNTRIGSPALDLAFLLYLNTSAELRTSCWDSLVEDYLQAVGSHRRQLLNEIFCRALYGYVHASFFLPVMTTPPGDYDTFDGDVVLNLGGDQATRYITDIVRHMAEKKYISAFLDFYAKRKK